MTDSMFVLHDGYPVQLSLYNGVLQRVESVITRMKTGKKYTLKRLCGSAFWDPLGPGQQRIAGRCFSHMVLIGRLPLPLAKSDHEYPKRYKLK